MNWESKANWIWVFIVVIGWDQEESSWGWVRGCMVWISHWHPGRGSKGFPSASLHGDKRRGWHKAWKLWAVILQKVKTGGGGMYGESNMETYITIGKINSQWEFAVWPRELTPGFCNNLERSDGEGGGMEVREGGEKCIPLADLCWCLAEINRIW